MFPSDLPQKLPVLRVELRFHLRGESLGQMPQGVRSRHHGLAEVEDVGCKLLEVCAAADLLGQPSLQLSKLDTGKTGGTGPFRPDRRGSGVGEAHRYVRLRSDRVLNLLLAVRR